MKNSLLLLFILLSLLACTSRKVSSNGNNTDSLSKIVTNDTVRIANDSLQYEVIIIEPGFDFWLKSTAFPRKYYSQSYLEAKNNLYVLEWNNRVMQPQRFSSNLYEMTIDYNTRTDYGYEVNYLIYNYMIYFQNKYNQKLYGYVPPR